MVWFKVDIAIPRGWRGREVHFLWDSSSEACVWIDGVPVQGLTGTGAAGWMELTGPVRPQYLLTKSARGGERISFHLEMACNHFFNEHPLDLGLLRQAEIAVFDREAWDLLWDYTIVAGVGGHLARSSSLAAPALVGGDPIH